MGKTAISWTDYSNNPIRFRNIETGKVGWHCEKVSQGCANCYAETLNMKWGTLIPFTVTGTGQKEVFFDSKMAGQVYKIKEPHARVFMFDMTDIFGRFIPDHIRAAAWAVMLDNPQHTFQVLTKRPESAVLWNERYLAAVQSPEYAQLVEQATNQKVKAALVLGKTYGNVWAANIWMGTSVENKDALGRIKHLQATPAKTRFISAEPLLGAWGSNVDLSGIHWVIVGGESGSHLTTNEHPRWMDQAWAREIRDTCVRQGVSFFMKQDSGTRTELRTYLVEEDGSKWKWAQYPDDFADPVNVDSGESRPAWSFVEGMSAPKLSDDEWVHEVNAAARRLDETYLANMPRVITAVNGDVALAEAAVGKIMQPDTDAFVDLASGGKHKSLADIGKALSDITVPLILADNPSVRAAAQAQLEEAAEAVRKAAMPLTTVVAFADVRQLYNERSRTWLNRDYVYIGRENYQYSLPPSEWRNPYKLDTDTPANRLTVLKQYRDYLLRDRPVLLARIEELRGKTLVCWCKTHEHPHRLCHGDVLLSLLNIPNDFDAALQEEASAPIQLTMF